MIFENLANNALGKMEKNSTIPNFNFVAFSDIDSCVEFSLKMQFLNCLKCRTSNLVLKTGSNKLYQCPNDESY